MKLQMPIFNYSMVVNAAESKAEVYVDGDIVDASTQEMAKWWGDETSVSYKSFRNQVMNCGHTSVDIFINSYGGHVGDAMAIHDLISDLNNKGWTINTYGRGMVCSSATYLLMAGKNGGSVSSNSSFMIHNVAGAIWGNVNEIENYGRMMRKFNNMIVDFYAKKTGKTADVITDLMNKETWFIGQEIVDNGFAATCEGAAPITNSIAPEKWPYKNRSILNKYNSQININNTMNWDKFKEDLLNGIKGIFNKDGKEGNEAPKPEDIASGVAAAVTNVLKASEEERQTAITNAVNAALKGEDFKTGVRDIVNEATKGFVNEAKFEKLVNDLADKLGKPGSASNPTNSNDDDPYKDIKVEV